MSSMADRKDSSQILQELDSLSHSLYKAHTSRRNASFALPRSDAADADKPRTESRPRSRRLSMSPWRSHPKSQHNEDNDDDDDHHHHHHTAAGAAVAEPASAREKKGIWNWKPMRALSHIRMQRLGCLFSVEVVAVQGLPTSMNGLRLSVFVRKKETKDGAVQTMPARVLQGSADFEETLFVRCHVYCTGKPLKLEPRPFVISAVAIDAPEVDLGRSTVDLSSLVKESMDKSLEGTRVRQWDVAFPLVGKAKGGELVLKLGFQIMEDVGVGIYNQHQAEAAKSTSKGRDSSTLSFSFARKQSKSSFSVASPKITQSEPSSTPTTKHLFVNIVDLKGIDEFSLDELGPPESSPSPAHKPEPEPEPEPKDDLDLPEFEIVDKGVEIQEDKEGEAAETAENADTASASSEVVKEVVVHDSAHLTRLTELDAIAKQINALESMMTKDQPNSDAAKTAAQDDDDELQQLDAEEETVTREFLQMLELEGSKDAEFDMPDRFSPSKIGTKAGSEAESGAYISDLGKGLGSVVQTRDGGFLAATNPFDAEVARRKDPAKLAMQLSKPFVLAGDQQAASGFELFQRLATVGSDELSSKLSALAAMDELTGKTAEQIAFEGMASAIISGRSKELGASSSAAKSVAALKTMAAALSDGRKERILTGIWNVREEPVLVEEILPFSLQKIEAMAIEALKIQAEMAAEQAPFDVSPLVNKQQSNDVHPLDSAAPPEAWGSVCAGADTATVLVAVQLRDPLRRYETVGAPTIAVIQAARAGEGNAEEGRFKVSSLHVGGLKLRAGRGGRWDGERQRLTAMQWLVAYGLVKAAGGKKGMAAQAKAGKDVVWSMSSRVAADMWLKSTRNPDVKIPEQ